MLNPLVNKHLNHIHTPSPKLTAGNNQVALFSTFKIDTRINVLAALAMITMASILGLTYYQKQGNNPYLQQ